MYLANTTLVVVPGVLIQHWRDELEAHMDTALLRVLEIGKDPLPDIQRLLETDVRTFRLDITRRSDCFRSF